MGITYTVAIKCLPECEWYEPDWRATDNVHISDPAEAIRILNYYSKIEDHKVTIFIDEEADD